MIKSSGPGGEKEKMRSAAQNEKGAVYALTLYSVVQNAGRKAAWVALKPETGRTHQLRFHMAEMGTAIVGDHKYTCDRETPQGLADGLHLHARALRLPPVKGGKPIEIVARAAGAHAADFRNARLRRTLHAELLRPPQAAAAAMTGEHP